LRRRLEVGAGSVTGFCPAAARPPLVSPAGCAGFDSATISDPVPAIPISPFSNHPWLTPAFACRAPSTTAVFRLASQRRMRGFADKPIPNVTSGRIRTRPSGSHAEEPRDTAVTENARNDEQQLITVEKPDRLPVPRGKPACRKSRHKGRSPERPQHECADNQEKLTEISSSMFGPVEPGQSGKWIQGTEPYLMSMSGRSNQRFLSDKGFAESITLPSGLVTANYCLLVASRANSSVCSSPVFFSPTICCSQ
jgi:hypothetical protein